MLRNELKDLDAKLKKGGEASVVSDNAVTVLKLVEAITKEICIANCETDGEGGVVVVKMKKGKRTTKKLNTLGAYLIECDAMKKKLSKQLMTRLHQTILSDRNRIQHEKGVLYQASKGLEYCCIGFELLDAVKPHNSQMEAEKRFFTQ
jgi:hypothetical protein